MNNPENQGSIYYQQQANSEFETAVRRGFWRSVLSWFSQKSNRLLPFDEIRQLLPFHGQHYAGLREIPIDQIVGSVARYNDFDRAFIPKQRHTKERWISIDMANLQSVNLPPIDAYKIGEVYFVKDGNHRVSVARDKGQAFIDAYITEISTPLPVTNIDDILSLVRDQERLEFFDKTNIKKIRPQAEIELTLPGQYQKLLEHISVHRWFMGERMKSEISVEEAVADWYDEVYLPLANLILAQNILQNFPKRTVADLYLWIIEHLWYLREEYQQEISLEQAVEHFKQVFSKKRGNPITGLFMRLAELLVETPAIEASLLPEDMLKNEAKDQTGEEFSSPADPSDEHQSDLPNQK